MFTFVNFVVSCPKVGSSMNEVDVIVSIIILFELSRVEFLGVNSDLINLEILE
jgi:hypothetical protein